MKQVCSWVASKLQSSVYHSEVIPGILCALILFTLPLAVEPSVIVERGCGIPP